MSQVSSIIFRRQPLAVGLAAALLVSCGGGGGTPTPSPSPPPTNNAPQFTSATTATVAENSTGVVYTAAANDADGDPLTFSIAGGADASAFTLSGGSLSFANTPNFDLFADADNDNVYSVTLQVSDGRGGAASRTVSVTVTNDREGVGVSKLADGFGANSLLADIPDKPELLIVRQDGGMLQVDATTGAANSLGNAFLAGETGRVLSAEYLSNFVFVMLDIDGQGIFVRAIQPGNPFKDIGVTMLASSSTLAPEGSLFRTPTGTIGAVLGDPSGNFAQNSTNGHGKLFDLGFDPFCGASTNSTCLNSSVIGDGIREPGGGAKYQSLSVFFDRGESNQDEINAYDPGATPLDFGWPDREGTFVRVTNPSAVVNGPKFTIGRGSGPKESTGLVGGGVYTGGIASLQAMLIFADGSGKIFAVPAGLLSDHSLHTSSEIENRTLDFQPSTSSIDAPRKLLVDTENRIFILDSDGELFRVDQA